MAQLMEQLERLIQPLLDEMNLELVDLEYKREQQGWTLRFYLDKDGGVTLDDCAAASREISTLLDVEDLIDGAYHLEVSSPGIERPLKKLSDFQRFSGRPVKIKTLTGLDPEHSGRSRKTFSGQLIGIEGSDVLLRIEEKDNLDIRIPFSDIDKANLIYEF